MFDFNLLKNICGNDQPYAPNLPISSHGHYLTSSYLNIAKINQIYDGILIDDYDDHQGLIKINQQNYTKIIIKTKNLIETVKILHKSELFWVDYHLIDGFYYIIFRNKRKMKARPWQGESGKSIFVYSDWGYGDFFRHIRFLNHLNFKEIILEIRPGLERMYSGKGILKGEPIPKTEYQVEICDIHKYLNLVPQPPYIHSSANNKKNGIGICPIGSKLTFNPQRNINIDDFPKSIQFFYLQKEKIELPKNIIDLNVKDWQDTCDRIAELDYVISNDTAVAHLCGAMNKLCYVLLSKKQYPTPITDNPRLWNPSLKLIYQENDGCWKKEIKRCLKSEVL